MDVNSRVGNIAGAIWVFGCAAGDLLFTLVQRLQPAKDSAKITGMLLEMTEPEILHILEDRDALIKKACAPFLVHHFPCTPLLPNAGSYFVLLSVQQNMYICK